MKYPIQIIILLIIILCLSTVALHAAEDTISAKDFCLKAENIAKQGTPEAFQLLITMYKNKPKKRTLGCLAKSLAQVNREQTVNFLINDLQDNDTETKAKAAISLGVIKEKRAINLLQKAFLDPDSGIGCNAAKALGAMKAPDSLQILIPALKSEYTATRRCTIRALRAYEDPINCQKFYDMWINDSDEIVQTEAGIAVVFDNCENEITRSNEYLLDRKYCKDAQLFIEKTTDAVLKYGTKWDRNIDYGINMNEIDYNEPNEEKVIKFKLLMAAGAWGKSVDVFSSAKDHGSLEMNEKRHFVKIVDYRQKEEMIKHFCPDVEFPNFVFWNKVIQENQK